MSDAAELVVRIRADASALERELKKMQTTTQNSAKAMSSSFSSLTTQMKGLLPAIGVGALVQFATQAWNTADRLNDLSQRTGVAASTLSALSIPLLQGGSNIEEFSASVNKMNNIIGEAAKGESENLIKTFNKLGLNIQALRQLSPEQQFYEIANSLNKIKNQADFTNAGMEIFGRSFSSLAPLIREADGDLKNFTDTRKDSALTEEELKMIDAFGDAWVGAIGRAQVVAVKFLTTTASMIAALSNISEGAAGSYSQAKLGNVPKDAAKGYVTSTSGVDAYSTDLNFRRSLDKAGLLKYGETPEEMMAKMIGGGGGDLNKPNIFTPKGDGGKAKIESSREALSKYTDELKRHFDTAKLSGEAKEGMDAYLKTEELAKKAGLSVSEIKAKAEANQQLAESISRTREEQEEAIKVNDQWRTQLSSALTDAILNFNSASDAAANLARSIAQMIIQRTISEPLVDGLLGKAGTGAGGMLGGFLNDIIPSFAVGADNIPHDMVANIHKGEMIIPAVQANAIRNGGGAGGSIVVNQMFQVSNDVPALIEAKIRNSAPIIASAAHDAVFASMSRGGAASKMIGAR